MSTFKRKLGYALGIFFILTSLYGLAVYLNSNIPSYSSFGAVLGFIIGFAIIKLFDLDK